MNFWDCYQVLVKRRDASDGEARSVLTEAIIAIAAEEERQVEAMFAAREAKAASEAE